MTQTTSTAILHIFQKVGRIDFCVDGLPFPSMTQISTLPVHFPTSFWTETFTVEHPTSPVGIPLIAPFSELNSIPEGSGESRENEEPFPRKDGMMGDKEYP